ncbi:MAG TPA: protein-disulfide reductase DsbD [Gammaproteobacteria bacterium]|nr:protein-disulfide reductase DsbD [Gammaproteobacteria bacterium]
MKFFKQSLIYSCVLLLLLFSNVVGAIFNNEPLRPEQAFIFTADVVDENRLRAKWDITEGYYLYKDKFKFKITGAEGLEITQVSFPEPGKLKHDEYFGEMEVYYGQAIVDLTISRSNDQATEFTLEAKSQGCADSGFCYPPQTESIPMVLSVGDTNGKEGSGPFGSNTLTDTTSSTEPLKSASAVVISEQDRIVSSLGDDGFFWTVLTFFGFGLLLAFTPCVFPMIPILSSLIVGQGEKINTRKAFMLSLIYVLAMAATYAVAGMIAGLFGANVQIMFQNPWVISAFSVIFVLLALSMFGFYELQLPASLQSKLVAHSNKQARGTWVGAGVMGVLSALIVGPCVAAPLAGALIYIGQSGDALLGGVALFVMALGMGMPLLVIGTTAGKWLPKSGGWMNAVKAVFGVLLLAVAIWMLERIIPEPATLMLWAVLLIISAIYMGALEPLPTEATGWRTLWKGSGLVMLLYGLLLMLGAASGGKDPLQPLKSLSLSSSPATVNAAPGHLAFTSIKGLAGLEQKMQLAKAQGQPVMLDFYADWCISCKTMERNVFSDPSVMQMLSGMMVLQSDVTENDEQDKALLEQFELIGPPSILFFDRNGDELRGYRIVGEMSLDEFQTHLSGVLNALNG